MNEKLTELFKVCEETARLREIEEEKENARLQKIADERTKRYCLFLEDLKELEDDIYCNLKADSFDFNTGIQSKNIRDTTIFILMFKGELGARIEKRRDGAGRWEYSRGGGRLRSDITFPLDIESSGDCTGFFTDLLELIDNWELAKKNIEEQLEAMVIKLTHKDLEKIKELQAKTQEEGEYE